MRDCGENIAQGRDLLRPWWPSKDLITGAFAEFDGDIHFFTAAVNADLHGVPGSLAIQDHVHVESTGNLLVVDGDDEVPAVEARSSSGSASRHRLDQQSFLNGKIERFSKPAAHG